MGFRSYVRHFCGAISKLFRPSLPWGFAAGSGSLLGVAASTTSSCSSSSSRDPSFTAAVGASSAAGEKVAKIIIFYGFQKLR